MLLVQFLGRWVNCKIAGNYVDAHQSKDHQSMFRSQEVGLFLDATGAINPWAGMGIRNKRLQEDLLQSLALSLMILKEGSRSRSLLCIGIIRKRNNSIELFRMEEQIDKAVTDFSKKHMALIVAGSEMFGYFCGLHAVVFPVYLGSDTIAKCFLCFLPITMLG